jgi:hypothetical protein
LVFQSQSRILPNRAKFQPSRAKKIKGINFAFLVRIEPFQWVTLTPRALFCLLALCRIKIIAAMCNVEAAHLRRHELLGRVWRAASGKTADVFAQSALGHAFACGDLGDRHALVHEADEPNLALGLRSARSASRRNRAIAVGVAAASTAKRRPLLGGRNK